MSVRHGLSNTLWQRVAHSLCQIHIHNLILICGLHLIENYFFLTAEKLGMRADLSSNSASSGSFLFPLNSCKLTCLSQLIPLSLDPTIHYSVGQPGTFNALSLDLFGQIHRFLRYILCLWICHRHLTAVPFQASNGNFLTVLDEQVMVGSHAPGT